MAKTPILVGYYRAIGLATAVLGTIGSLAIGFITIQADAHWSYTMSVTILGVLVTSIASLFQYGIAQLLSYIAQIAANTAAVAAHTQKHTPPASKLPAYRCPHCRAGIQSVSPGINTCPKCGVDFVAE